MRLYSTQMIHGGLSVNNEISCDSFSTITSCVLCMGGDNNDVTV